MTQKDAIYELKRGNDVFCCHQCKKLTYNGCYHDCDETNLREPRLVGASDYTIRKAIKEEQEIIRDGVCTNK